MNNQEINELAQLISMYEITQVVSINDLKRRQELEARASDTELMKACKIAKVSYADIFEGYEGY